jgi:hypothetical protein
MTTFLTLGVSIATATTAIAQDGFLAIAIPTRHGVGFLTTPSSKLFPPNRTTGTQSTIT